jgi:hypothetical protein
MAIEEAIEASWGKVLLLYLAKLTAAAVDDG